MELQQSQSLVGPGACIIGVEFNGAFRVAQGFWETLLQELLPAAVEPC